MPPLTEEKPKWTPGRWMAASKPSSVIGWPIVATLSGRSIASVAYAQHIARDAPFNCESEANAHLIAAAPDLYEALDQAVNYIAAWAVTNNDSEASAFLDTTTAALAKARGDA